MQFEHVVEPPPPGVMKNFPHPGNKNNPSAKQRTLQRPNIK